LVPVSGSLQSAKAGLDTEKTRATRTALAGMVLLRTLLGKRSCLGKRSWQAKALPRGVSRASATGALKGSTIKSNKNRWRSWRCKGGDDGSGPRFAKFGCGARQTNNAAGLK
jgi:hypothetical protein